MNTEQYITALAEEIISQVYGRVKIVYDEYEDYIRVTFTDVYEREYSKRCNNFIKNVSTKQLTVSTVAENFLKLYTAHVLSYYLK